MATDCSPLSPLSLSLCSCVDNPLRGKRSAVGKEGLERWRGKAESELEACQTIRRRKIYRRAAASLFPPPSNYARRQFGWKKEQEEEEEIGSCTPFWGTTGTLPTFVSSKQFKRANDKLLENYVHKKARAGRDCDAIDASIDSSLVYGLWLWAGSGNLCLIIWCCRPEDCWGFLWCAIRCTTEREATWETSPISPPPRLLLCVPHVKSSGAAA